MADLIRIAVDAMGGDFYPHHPIKGALQALQELPDDFSIVLIGDRDTIQHELGKHPAVEESRLEIVHAAQVIGSRESLNDARGKRDSSIHVGVSLVKQEKAQAYVSAGNTGALVAISVLSLGRIAGVKRPALVAVFPTIKGIPSVVLDVGANAECRPVFLEQFALLGKSYAQLVLGCETPRVGLINVGTEVEKGNEVTVAAHQLLVTLAEAGEIIFAGNVEGNTVFSGECQVLVTDGFTGNVILKMAEGIKPNITAMLRQTLRSGRWDQKLFALVAFAGGKVFLGPTLGALKRSFDYAKYGGAPLLGVNGTVYKAHGRSTPEAFRHAIAAARQAVLADLTGVIRSRMAAYRNGNSISTYKTGDP